MKAQGLPPEAVLMEVILPEETLPEAVHPKLLPTEAAQGAHPPEVVHTAEADRREAGVPL